MAAVVALGLACALSSCMSSMKMLSISMESTEPIKFEGLQRVTHDNILVEDEDGNVRNIDKGLATEPEPEPEPCTLTDVSCDPEHHSYIASGNVAFMDTCGVCRASGKCLDGYTLKDDRCWFNPESQTGEVGPFYDPDFTRRPDARCQANAQWMDLDYQYYDTKLNCDLLNCQENSRRFCFNRGSEQSCENTASGYYGNSLNDRVQDCIWVPET
tara:strand:+ start:47 stop:688 length:642 start_codon:yes stop_codon:yes gene_type:complete